jgi:ankyrin repeat protein
MRIRYGNRDMVKYLLEHEAEAKAVDAYGETALHLATGGTLR